MKRALTWLTLILILAAILHTVIFVATPYVIMRVTLNRLAELVGGYNLIGVPLKTDATTRLVVRPSPDLAYAACIFDVSRAPVRITAPKSKFYSSLALIGDNSDNFFVVNDRQVSTRFDVVVIAANAPAPNLPADATLVRAPSTQGLALVRYFIPSDAEFAEVDQLRHTATCESLFK